VDQSGTQLSIKTPVVAAVGTLITKTMTYDLLASMNVTLASDVGYQLPTPLPAINYVKLNALGTLVRQTVPASAGSTAISSLWPWSTGYAAWPGGCPDSDPATAPTSGGTRGANIIIAPGTTGAVTARLAPVALTVQTSPLTLNVPIPNVVVTATNVSTGALACSTPDKTLTLGTTDASGKLKTSLPFGNWTLNTTYRLLPAGPGPVVANTDPITPLGSGLNNELFVVN